MELLLRLQNVTALILSALPNPTLWQGPAAVAIETQLEQQLRELEGIKGQLWLN